MLRILWRAVKDVFLFAPDKKTVDEIKNICQETLTKNHLEAKFYDITRTGRHLWIAIYFTISEDCLYVEKLKSASTEVNKELENHFENCTCELILIPNE